MRSPRSALRPFLALLSFAGLTAFAFGGTLPRRAILVSFDGAGGLDLEERLADGTFSPDGFARARSQGFSARRLVVVTPSLTAVSHAAISSGAPPSKTGIVANWFHPASEALRVRVNGFEVESEVETIWEAAARQGKRVCALTWPGVTQRSPRSSAPVAMRYVDAKPHGTLWRGPTALHPLADLTVSLPLGTKSFSPPKTFTLDAAGNGDGGRDVTLTFAVIDTTDDGRRNYDEIAVLSSDGSLAARARPGQWFSLSETRDEGDEKSVLFGRWGKVLALSPDLSRLVVYVGNEARTYAYPEDFRRTLEARAGFWPGPPDPALLESAEDTASFLEQATRFCEFFVSAFDVADRRGDWDLLLGYLPVLDETEHVALLLDPRQPWYTPARAAKASALVRDVWRVVDRAAARYMRFRAKGDVFFVSDHGMRPITRSLYIEELLRRLGFLKAEVQANGKRRVAADSPVDASTGGGVAFVLVNRAGVLPGGVVPPEKVDALVAQIADALRRATDDDGKLIFSQVATRLEAADLGLDHPNAGDLVLVAAGGTTMRGGFPPEGEKASLFGEGENPGQHGFGPDPKLDGIFFHSGEGIEPQRVESFRAVDVAARISERLQIEPPRTDR